jgi:8-oxo-dGTP pyrophosphatase MutT (NUDIX family)
MSVIEHHIQRTIVDRLMHAEQLRFSDLKPTGMESNIFMYHLKQLLKDGYVERTDGGYRLAAKGLSYVDELSNENQRPRPQPKLINIIALTDGAGKWLLAERKVQPYIGMRMFPSGKRHRGETSAEHATRELHEKTGLSDILLSYRGIADVQIFDAAGTLLTHAIADIYEGRVKAGLIPSESDRFRYCWHDFTHDTAKLMPATQEVYEQLQQPGRIDAVLAKRTLS